MLNQMSEDSCTSCLISEKPYGFLAFDGDISKEITSAEDLAVLWSMSELLSYYCAKFENICSPALMYKDAIERIIRLEERRHSAKESSFKKAKCEVCDDFVYFRATSKVGIVECEKCGLLYDRCCFSHTVLSTTASESSSQGESARRILRCSGCNSKGQRIKGCWISGMMTPLCPFCQILMEVL
jgi:hypothetical protein